VNAVINNDKKRLEINVNGMLTYVQLKAMKHNNSCTYQKLKKTTYYIMNRTSQLYTIHITQHNKDKYSAHKGHT